MGEFTGKRIAVTGAGGFLGSRAAERLESAGHTVLRLTRAEADITDFTAVKRALFSFGAECVIHCAAIADIGMCEKDRVAADGINVGGTRNVASACADLDAAMVFISSDQVYDYRGPGPLDEYAPVLPLNYYGFTKAEGERAAASIVKKHFIARIAWQYDFPRADEGGGLWRLAERAVGTGRALTYGGENYRSVNYVSDTADALAAMAEGRLPYGIYNVASPNDLNERETYRLILRAAGAADADSLLEEREAPKVDLRAEPRNLKLSGYELPTVAEGIERCRRDKAAYLAAR